MAECTTLSLLILLPPSKALVASASLADGIANNTVECQGVPANVPLSITPVWGIPRLTNSFDMQQFYLSKNSLRGKSGFDEFPWPQLGFTVTVNYGGPNYGYLQQITKSEYPDDLDARFVFAYADENSRAIRTMFLSHYQTCYLTDVKVDELKRVRYVTIYQY